MLLYIRMCLAAAACVVMFACGGGGGGDGQPQGSAFEWSTDDVSGNARARPVPTMGALEVN